MGIFIFFNVDYTHNIVLGLGIFIVFYILLVISNNVIIITDEKLWEL